MKIRPLFYHFLSLTFLSFSFLESAHATRLTDAIEGGLTDDIIRDRIREAVGDGTLGTRDQYGLSPLGVACYYHKDSVVKMLLTAGASFDEFKDMSAQAQVAAFNHAIDSCPSLAEHLVPFLKDVDMRAGDRCNMPPLIEAAQAGQRQIVEALAERGARLEATDDLWGMTAFARAVMLDLFSVTGSDEYLLEIAGKRLQIARFLAERGANVNPLDRDGLTPLIRLVKRRQPPSLVQVVVDLGADTSVKAYDKVEKREMSVHDYAEEALREHKIPREKEVSALEQYLKRGIGPHMEM